MTIPTTKLTRAAGVAAVVGGLLYIGVQTKHPNLDLALISTTEWKVRQTMKVLFAALSLAGITGMYLRQVKQIGVLGLLGYVVFSVGYLAMLSVEAIGAVVLPSIAETAPGYVSDVLAVAVPGGHAVGDLGLMGPLINLVGIAYLGGGLLFGIALFRAKVLARWAAALLAIGAVGTLAIPPARLSSERADHGRRVPWHVRLFDPGFLVLRPALEPCELRRRHRRRYPRRCWGPT